MIPFPDDSYLRSLARAVYAFAYLEWSILGDLDRLPNLSDTLSVPLLSRSSSGELLKRLDAAAEALDTSTPEGRWVRLAARAIAETKDTRNDILHSHPTTIGDQQVLYRWAVAKGESEHKAFPITESFLRHYVDLIGKHLRELDSCRLEQG